MFDLTSSFFISHIMVSSISSKTGPSIVGRKKIEYQLSGPVGERTEELFEGSEVTDMQDESTLLLKNMKMLTLPINIHLGQDNE